MQHATDFSNAVTAAVIILTFAIAAIGVHFSKPKKVKAPKRLLGQEAKDYSLILDVIIKAESPKDLYQVFKMKDDFKAKYTGVIPEREVNDYMHEISRHKDDKTLELLGIKITALNAQAV